MKSEQEIKSSLKAWVLKKNPTMNEADVTYDTHLLASRIISSLHIMEMILEIEKLKGEKFSLKNLKPGVFNSINSIYSAFFEPSL